MGFETNQGYDFQIPVSDTQSYRQFGNAVVVPVVRAVAEIMKPHIEEAIFLSEGIPTQKELLLAQASG